MRQLRQLPQRIQVRQLRHVIRRQDKARQVRYRRCQVRMDVADPVAREHQGAEAREEGEIREGGDVVVREVDRILVLYQCLA